MTANAAEEVLSGIIPEHKKRREVRAMGSVSMFEQKTVGRVIHTHRTRWKAADDRCCRPSELFCYCGNKAEQCQHHICWAALAQKCGYYEWAARPLPGEKNKWMAYGSTTRSPYSKPNVLGGHLYLLEVALEERVVLL